MSTPGSHETPRLLVIDDYQAIHDDIRKLLAAGDDSSERMAQLETDLFGTTSKPVGPRFRITSALQGEDGLACVRRALDEEDPFAVVVIDVRMPPGWDGVETIARIREIDRDVQIILCTAYSDYRWGDLASRLGHSADLLILKKPFDPIELQQMTSALELKWRLEHARRQLLQQVAMAERLAGIGQLAAGVSHEINNPLTYLLANQSDMRQSAEALIAFDAMFERGADLATLRAARSQLGGAAFFADLLQSAIDSEHGATRIAEIASDLRLLARRDDRAKRIDVAEVVRSALRVTGVQTRDRVRLTSHLAGPAIVCGHAGRLSQVFINLVVNATQAFGARPAHQNEIVVSCQREGDRVLSHVRDNGPGIDPAALPHIFEPFFTTKDVGAGTGLGLSISRDIVLAHHGDLRVASAPGHGATFTVDLPAVA